MTNRGGSEARLAQVVELAVLAVVFVFATLVRFPTLNQPLVETQPHRQTQTAYTARIFHEEGIDLLHPELPVLGEPWEVPFEFPLFQALASVPMAFGVSPDAAMRVTALGTFLLSAALIWGLMRYVTRRPVPPMAALVAFSFSPFALLWSRASMIEYLAVAGAVGFAFGAILWLDTRRWWWAVIALVAGLVGMLVKPTTTAFWVLPILGWTIGRAQWTGWGDWLRGVWAWFRRTARPTLLAVLIVPFLVALVWTAHADAIKARSPATAAFTEEGLRSWNFGTLEQRLSFDNWLTLFDRAENLIIGLGPLLWVGLFALALAVSRPRWFWVGIVLTGVLPVVVFFNLYVVHDYYLAAVTPAAAMLLGAGAGWLHERWHGARFGHTAAIGGVVLLGIVWLASNLLPTRSYWRTAYLDIDRSHPVLAGGRVTESEIREVREVTGPDDRIVVAGIDWSPGLLYYADRRGLMLHASNIDGAQATAEARRRGYQYFFALRPGADPVHLTRTWSWIGAVSQHVYRLGERPSEVMPAAMLGSTDPAQFDRVSAMGEKLVDGAISLSCGNPVSIPRGRDATWIRIGGGGADAARVSISDGIAPLPGVDIVVVPTIATGSPLELQCAGVESLSIEAVVSGPRPDSEGS